MARSDPLKIAIDARCSPDRAGGVSKAVMSLVAVLGKLDGSEKYSVVVESEEQLEWLRPLAGPNQHFHIYPKEFRSNGNLTRKFRQPVARLAKKIIRPPTASSPHVPDSNGFFESLNCDLIHFPTQRFIRCALPSVYNPHDLQHLHFPQFFTPAKLAKRETIYRAGCRFAQTVVVGSQWVKDDVINSYRVSPDRVQVIPEHSPSELTANVSADSMAATREKYHLPDSFAIYPAIAWPHKNHIRLFEALAYLRDSRGLMVYLVCTGSRYDPHWPQIEDCLRKLKLESQVTFSGFVSEMELKALYRLADFLVMPTLFEASSLPIFEAWLEGTPVASSRVTALPDQVGDAGLLFDASDVGSIAEAVARMATDKGLRDRLRSRGYRRLQDFDGRRTAKAYRAVYRRVAGQSLSPEDRWLLSWDWMRYPERKEVAYV